MINVLEHAKENPAMYTIVAATVVVLGGTFSVELPADRGLAEVRIEIAQNYERREQQFEQQQLYHKKGEIEQIDFKMEWTSNEINRLNQIPIYLKRPLTAEESWVIEQRKIEWNTLQKRRTELTQ